MIKLLCVAIVAGLVFESNQQRLEAKKLEPEKLELNQLEPEKLELNQLPTKFPCDYPTHIQCWTDWFDRDDPSGTGDWELLYNLRIENPGKICPKPIQIEAKTLTGLSAAAAGDVIFKSDTTTGFICKNQDQKSKKMCNDYRVRFSCHPPFCGGVCWTNWYDRDRPSGTGDWETLSDLKKTYPGEICDSPMYIEAVTTDTMTPAISTGENFLHYNPTVGFVCRMVDQIDGECLNYKVRFGCPCK
ncbi:mucin-5AC [Pleuronectes platessa]|uniref:mucin-5AC n=1 Tax=Pleuronectes platessa TaxID=8262 RepID=UPI00232A5B6F|nr:mucin-5AC [Pleuronectes platessa]XP_053301790.1 mucin-5AC [Pleuronectes platessa]